MVQEEAYRLVIVCSVGQALVSTVISVGIALCAAHCFFVYQIPYRKGWIVGALAAAVVPTKCVAMATSLLNMDGIYAIIASHCLLNIPLAFLFCIGAYESCGSDSYWASLDCGASLWQQYTTVQLPLIIPTIWGVSSTVFVACLSSFSIPLLLARSLYDYTMPVMAYKVYAEGEGVSSTPFTLYMALFGLVVFSITCLQAFFLTHQGSLRAPSSWYMQGHRRPLATGVALFLALLALCFCVVYGELVKYLIMGRSAAVCFDYYDDLLGASLATVMQKTIGIAAISSGGAVVIGLCLAMVSLYGSQRLFIALWIMVAAIKSLILSVGGVAWIPLWCTYSPLLWYGTLIGSYSFLNYSVVCKGIQWHLAYLSKEFWNSAFLYEGSWWLKWWYSFGSLLAPVCWRFFCVAFGFSLSQTGIVTMLFGNQCVTLSQAIRVYWQHGMHDEALVLGFVVVGLTGMAMGMSTFFGGVTEKGTHFINNDNSKKK